jgi:hypothetical protein
MHDCSSGQALISLEKALAHYAILPVLEPVTKSLLQANGEVLAEPASSCRKFSAVRSAVSKLRAAPCSVKQRAVALYGIAIMHAPFHANVCINLVHHFINPRPPAHNHRFAGDDARLAALLCRDELRGNIAGADVFRERGAHLRDNVGLQMLNSVHSVALAGCGFQEAGIVADWWVLCMAVWAITC